MASNLAQFAFRNVVDNVLVPAGVKVGGYPDDMFLDLDEDEQEKYKCNICYLIVKDCKECENSHLFCAACIFAWTLTYGQNSDKCPVCRSTQRLYKDAKAVDRTLGDKKIHCPVEGCRFTGRLQIFLLHIHGREKFSNADIDFESLRNRHPGPIAAGALPPLSTSLNESTQRLRQNRSMLHQLLFMFQWQLEMRRRSLQAQLHAFDPGENTADRLDEAMALQIQVDELGAMMGVALMSLPSFGREARAPRPPADTSPPPRAVPPTSTASTLLRQTNRPTTLFNASQYRNAESSDEDDDSDSDASGVVSTARLRAISRRNESVTRVLSSNGLSNATAASSVISDVNVRQRRSESVVNSNPLSSSSNGNAESRPRQPVQSSSISSGASPSSSSNAAHPPQHRLPMLNRETMAAPTLQTTNTQTTPRASVSVGVNAGVTSSEPPGSDAQTTLAQVLDANEERLPQVARPNSVFRSRSRMDSNALQNSASRSSISVNDMSVFRSQTVSNNSAQSPPVNDGSSVRSTSVNHNLAVSSPPQRPHSDAAEEQRENESTAEQPHQAAGDRGSRERPNNGVRSDAVRANSQVTQGRVNRRPGNRQSSNNPQTQAGGRNRSLPRDPSLSRSTTRLSVSDNTRARGRQNDHASTRPPARPNNSSRNNDHHRTSENNGAQQRAGQQRPTAPQGASGNREQPPGSNPRTGSRPSGTTPRQLVRARRRSEIHQELMDQRRDMG